MKKFGLGKKDKSEKPTIESSAPTGTAVASEDSSRSRLFGSRNKAKPASPAPANPNSNPYAVSNASSGGNPYANAPAPGLSVNPYASGGNGAQKNGQQDPYLQNSRGAPSGYGNPSRGNGYDNRDLDRTQSSATAPPAYDANPSGPTYRDTKSQPQPQSQTQNNNYSGYNNTGSYNKQAGYGDDRYSEASSIATTRVGGYGGFGGGRNDSRETLDTDAGKAALFGNARERLQQRQAETQLPPEEDPAQGGAYGGSSGGGYGESQGYGAQYDSQLTAEEQEEADVGATKSEIKDLKREDVSLLRNGLRIAQQAEETGRATLERLGIQGEMIHNAEKNLDLSANQNRIAEEKRKEIVRLNRSMFIPAAGNPFTKNRRIRQMDEQVLEQHHKDKSTREKTRAAAYESLERQNETQRRLRDAWETNNNPKNQGLSAQVQAKKGASLKERSKYQFEADSEDEDMENEIDEGLDQLAGAAGRLNLLGKAIGTELESQNRHIERIAGKVDTADDELEMLRAKLARIN